MSISGTEWTSSILDDWFLVYHAAGLFSVTELDNL